MTLNLCRWSFLLLIVSLPIVRPFGMTLFGIYVPATDFIFLFVCATWLVALLRGETRLQFSKLYLFLGLYALALTVSTVFSIEPGRSFPKLLGEFYLFGLAVVTFNLVRDQDHFRSVTYAWLIGTGLTVLASVAGFVLFYLGYKTQSTNYFLSHIGSLPEGNYPRVQALFANPNMLTNFLNVSLMLTILAAKADWLSKIWTQLLRVGIWLSALLALSAGIGGMILSSGIWWWAMSRANKKLVPSRLLLATAILGATLIFALTLISPDTANTDRDFSTPFAEKKFEPSVRVLVWENAFHKFTEFPILGRGTGTRTAEFQYQTLSGGNQILLDAHNVWLNVLGQTGLLGIVAFAALVFYLATKCRFSVDNTDTVDLIRLALSCSFAGAFLYQGLSGSFEDARHLWILFGLLVAASTFPRSDASEASSQP